MARNVRLTNDQRKELERRSGLDVLKRFIPDSDYNDALIEHAAKNTPTLDSEGNIGATREAMIERSIAMMTYLRDNGYDFSVTADRRDGQLTAKIEDMNMSVRIMDTDENLQYVGRVYSDGITYYYSNKQSYLNNNLDISPDMSVNLIKYALGESVSRVNNMGPRPVVLDAHVGSPDATVAKYKPDTYTIFKSGAMDSFTSLYSKGKSRTISGYDGKPRTVFDNAYIYAKVEMHTGNQMRFDGDDALVSAENFVEDSRSNAIQNLTKELKLDALDKLAQSKAAGEFDGLPEFSANSNFVVDMQKAYYDGRLGIYTNADFAENTKARNDALYEHDDAFRQSIEDVFGSVRDRSINPINVSVYMDKTKGSINNEDNLCSALKYIQQNSEPYELLGDDFAANGFKDRMVAYDSKPVYDNNGIQIYPKSINPDADDFEKLSDFWKNIGQSVQTGLSETGVRVKSIDVDKNGVIHYEGDRHIGESSVSKPENKVIGNIGQVFEPDNQDVREDGSPNLKKGLIETKFRSGENYYIAPGYTAYVVPPSDNNPDASYEERTRLRGYEQEMTHAIKSSLRHNVIANNKYDDTSGLNNVYHHIYGDKLPLDFEEQMSQEGKDAGVITAIVDSSLRRVRYDNCYKDGTDMLSEVRAKQQEFKANRGYDIYLDNVKANMAVMDPHTSQGIFDPYATGTGRNQGAVRYLVEDAVVNSDGSITKGQSDKSPLSAHPDFKYAAYNPPDRLIMSYMNAVNQSSTARGRTENLQGEKIAPIGVGTAHMSLGGYTQDDAFVVSRDFAEMNMIRGADGKMRPLQVEDKICDHSGNKGVISFIADRNADMSYYEPELLHADMSEKEYNAAVKRNNTKEMQKAVIDVFKDNPALDVIGAPYTAPSRFNGGTARELIDSQDRAAAAGMPTTLKIGGKEIDGAIGYCNWIVTDMPVDEKTHIYETEGGRKASGQLVWALSEAGAKDIIDEIYKYNNEPTIKAREMMLAIGLDISQTGEIHRGYQPHITGFDDNKQPVYEKRNEFSIKDAFESNRDAAGKPHKKNFNESFDKAMNDDGGFMKLPFPITMTSGDVTPEKLDENGKGTGEYMLPVLSAKYRSGRETMDGKLLVHEYTTNYKNIYVKAGDYLFAQEKFETAVRDNNTNDAAKYRKTMDDAVSSAQSAYNTMADNISERYFTGKHNIWKDDVMRKQLQGTGTVVISPDPSLDINEVSLTATTAASLNILNDPEPKALIWRDPVLSGGGVRYADVRIIENREGYPGYDARNPLNNQIGMGMNPSAATSFEADFDGDSMGLYGLQTAKAKQCAREKFSYQAQLLNKETGSRGEHSLYFQDGLDVAAGIFADAKRGGDIKSRFDEAKALANQADKNNDTAVDKNSLSNQAYEKFNEAMHDAHKAAFGCDVISYKSPKDHFESLIPMTESGAKGSPSKLVNGYGKYFGCKAEIDENFKLTAFEDLGQPYANVSDRQASLAATHAKAVLTGVAGKFSQHAIMLAKNSDECFSNSAAANALTHPVTQSVMQLKHDDSETILRKIDMITNVAPALWAGHKIQPSLNANGDTLTWEVVTQKNDKGQYENVAMSPDEWKKTFMQFYTDKKGLGVAPPNPEHIETMAKIMTVTENGRSYIKGFDSKTKEIMPMEKPLDRLTYESDIQTLCSLADTKAKLFDGSVNSYIAPKVIRDNIAETAKANEAKSMGEEYTPKLKALSAKDTQVKPVLDTPSVDAVDKMLKLDPTVQIHIVEDEKLEWERAGYQRHLADGRVIDVKPTTVYKSYDKMSPAAQDAIAKAVVDKFIAGDKNYTKPEQEFCNKLKEQTAEIKTLKTRAEQLAYMAAHDDTMHECNIYFKLKNAAQKTETAACQTSKTDVRTVSQKDTVKPKDFYDASKLSSKNSEIMDMEIQRSDQ